MSGRRPGQTRLQTLVQTGTCACRESDTATSSEYYSTGSFGFDQSWLRNTIICGVTEHSSGLRAKVMSYFKVSLLAGPALERSRRRAVVGTPEESTCGDATEMTGGGLRGGFS